MTNETLQQEIYDIIDSIHNTMQEIDVLMESDASISWSISEDVGSKDPEIDHKSWLRSTKYAHKMTKSELFSKNMRKAQFLLLLSAKRDELKANRHDKSMTLEDRGFRQLVKGYLGADDYLEMMDSFEKFEI